MNRRHCLGAIGFPAFLLAWTSGLMGVVVHLQPQTPAGAPPVLSLWERAPARDLPVLDDADAWSSAFVHLVRHSEVMNGAWQPGEEAAAEAGPGATLAVTTIELPPVRHRSAAVASNPGEPQGGQPAPRAAVTASTPSAAGSGVRKTPVTVGRALSLDKSRARRALTDGLVHDAYATLRPLVAAGRNDAEFLGLLALAALRVGHDDEALVIYRRLSGLEPDSGRWRTGLALAQERLGLDATDLYVEALARSEPAGALQHALLTRLEGAS